MNNFWKFHGEIDWKFRGVANNDKIDILNMGVQFIFKKSSLHAKNDFLNIIYNNFKYIIILLNKITELISKFRNLNKFLLSNYKSVPPD